MGRQVSRDSLPEEGSFVRREAKQAACYCLILCENTNSNSNEIMFISLTFKARLQHKYIDKIVQFDTFMTLLDCFTAG